MATDEPLIHYLNRQLIGLVSTQQYLSFVAEMQEDMNIVVTLILRIVASMKCHHRQI